jgi:hypothetical protein
MGNLGQDLPRTPNRPYGPPMGRTPGIAGIRCVGAYLPQQWTIQQYPRCLVRRIEFQYLDELDHSCQFPMQPGCQQLVRAAPAWESVGMHHSHAPWIPTYIPTC